MSYWLGIDVGTTFTAAAICRQGSGLSGVPEVVALGTRSTAVSSVVFLAPDGQVVVGEAAERRAVTDPDRVVREFKRRIGDEVPMVVGGRAHSAPEIAARVLGWVIERVAQREGGSAAGIVLTHPAGWGPYKLSTMTAAVRAAGLASVMFRTEPEAAAASYALAQRVESGSTIAVYDLGGGTFDAAVVRKTGVASWRVLGVPQGLEALGGADFDDVIMGHVLAAVPALAQLDPEDPATLAAMSALRRECTEAKEALSSDTEVTIPVLAPGVGSRVRLVRAEFEDMIRPRVVQTVEALRRALRSADVEPGDLDAVLLVGGSSRVPLVAQLVSAELGRPIAIDADPKAAIALGAALCALPTPATDVASDAPADVTPPARCPAPVFAVQDAPPRPSLTAIPLDVEPAAQQRHQSRSRLLKRVAVAGALSLIAAGGVAAAPLLTSQNGPVPQAAAGTPAPATAKPPASAATSDNASSSGPSSGAVLTVPVAESTKPASAAAKAGATPVHTAGHQTVSSTRPVPASSSNGNTPAPSSTPGGGTSIPIGDPAPPTAPGKTPTGGDGTGTTPTGGGTSTTPTGTGTTPTGGGTSTTPTGTGTTPTGGGTSTTPTGGSTSPSGGGTTPTGGGGGTTPSGGGTTPTSGGGGTTPTSGGGTGTAPAGGGTGTTPTGGPGTPSATGGTPAKAT